MVPAHENEEIISCCLLLLFDLSSVFVREFQHIANIQKELAGLFWSTVQTSRGGILLCYILYVELNSVGKKKNKKLNITPYQNSNQFIREYFRSCFMQQNVLSGRNMWSWYSETKQLCSSVAGGPSWLHPGACTRGPVSVAQGEDTLSLSISTVSLHLFMLLMKPCSQAHPLCFSSRSRHMGIIAQVYKNTLSKVRRSNTKVMGSAEVL